MLGEVCGDVLDTLVINMETVDIGRLSDSSHEKTANLKESAIEQARRTMLLNKAGSPTNRFSHFGQH